MPGAPDQAFCAIVHLRRRDQRAAEPKRHRHKQKEQVMLKKIRAAMARVFDACRTSSGRARGKRAPKRFMPELEGLQERVVPTVSFANGDLYITGTAAPDTVSVAFRNVNGI